MGMIGRWIDERCKAEPEVMRRVLNRKFGPLRRFLEADKCGCLVGSYYLERGDHPTNAELNFAGMMGQPAPRVGLRVNSLCFGRGENARPRKRSDLFVVRLIKQRIRKSLGIAPENRPVLHLESVSR